MLRGARLRAPSNRGSGFRLANRGAAGTIDPMELVLVEDDADARILTERFAAGLGHPIRSFASGEEALRAFEQKHARVVLVDWGLPSMDGLEFCRQLRRLPGGSHAYVIMLTIRQEAGDIQRAVESGVDDYLAKPFDQIALGVRLLVAERNLKAAAMSTDLQRLRESEERYELAARGTNDGIWDWDLRTDRVYYSLRWRHIAGADREPDSDQPSFWLDRMHPDDRERFRSQMKLHLSQGSTQFLSEHRLIDPGGAAIWVLARGLAIHDENGQAYRIAGSITDITAQKQLEENLFRNALYDITTGLPNQALFLDRLKSAFDRCSRNPNYLFAVVSLELDRFELLTESLKREKADDLLRSLVERLADRLRSSDTLARLGDNKFAVLLDDVNSQKEAGELFNQIQDEVSLPFRVGGSDMFLGVNMGIAMSDSQYEEAEQLLRDADVARYHAREKGGAGYEIYREFMQSHMRIRMKLETQLRLALQNMDFELHYQPIVSLSQKRVVGLEALLRWEHPELGRISPAQFVPLAEETGMIRPIGEWALRTACLQSKAWNNGGHDLYIAVNLSARQFQEEDLIALTRSCVSQADLMPELLVLELTESAAMKDHEHAMDVLHELRSLGFRVAIDDFGTGYSSLAYLKNMPADTLKVDRSFIRDVTENEDSAAIASAIIQLGRGLKRKVVAEGVETREQLDFLRSNGCDLIQGFYFSQPLPAGEVAAFLTNHEGLVGRIG